MNRAEKLRNSSRHVIATDDTGRPRAAARRTRRTSSLGGPWGRWFRRMVAQAHRDDAALLSTRKA